MTDLFNGLFELIGALLICLSIRRVRLDREVKGVSIFPVAFFAAWGLWNLGYYPSLDQWFSFAGALVMVVANLIWLAHLAMYTERL